MPIIRRPLWLITLVAVMAFWAARAQAADELITFDTAPYLLGKFQQRLAIERGEMAVATTSPVQGYLSRPEGDGPFPAVIYLHGCNGLSKATRDRVSRLLTGWGYVLLAVDSFATRGMTEACDRPMPDRQADAWGALLYLSKLGFVDRDRIALLGSSQGAIVAMRLASRHDVKLFDIPDALTFKAAVAYYPLCSVASDQLAMPALIMVGERDDWTPAEDCERWMARRQGKGAPAKLIVYPGAYHAFDVPGLKDGRRVFGHWLQYDDDAARRSVTETREFLADRLSK